MRWTTSGGAVTVHRGDSLKDAGLREAIVALVESGGVE